VSFEPHSVVVLAGRPAWSNTPPHPALAAQVSTYWTIRVEGAHTIRALPDGCTDVAFDLASATPRAFVTGPQAAAQTFTIAGGAALFGVRFRPGCAALLLGAPTREADRWVPLERWLAGEATTLASAVARAGCTAERVAVIDEVLVQRLAARVSDPRLGRAVARVFASGGTTKIEALARAAGASERTLGRLFAAGLGLSPKRFSRVVRFQALLRRIVGAPDWTRFAAEAGYSDQAHMSREFKQLFGCTPCEALGLVDNMR